MDGQESPTTHKPTVGRIVLIWRDGDGWQHPLPGMVYMVLDAGQALVKVEVMGDRNILASVDHEDDPYSADFLEVQIFEPLPSEEKRSKSPNGCDWWAEWMPYQAKQHGRMKADEETTAAALATLERIDDGFHPMTPLRTRGEFRAAHLPPSPGEQFVARKVAEAVEQMRMQAEHPPSGGHAGKMAGNGVGAMFNRFAWAYVQRFVKVVYDYGLPNEPGVTVAQAFDDTMQKIVAKWRELFTPPAVDPVSGKRPTYKVTFKDDPETEQVFTAEEIADMERMGHKVSTRVQLHADGREQYPHLDAQFDAGYVPSDSPPGLEEFYYGIWQEREKKLNEHTARSIFEGLVRRQPGGANIGAWESQEAEIQAFWMRVVRNVETGLKSRQRMADIPA